MGTGVLLEKSSTTHESRGIIVTVSINSFVEISNQPMQPLFWRAFVYLSLLSQCVVKLIYISTIFIKVKHIIHYFFIVYKMLSEKGPDSIF